MFRTQSQIKHRKNIREWKNTRRIFCKIYEINPYFFEHYKEKMQANKNGCEYILFRIDVYFIEYLLAAEIDEKVHTDRGLIFEKKGKQL